MKKMIALLTVFCLLLAGCADTREETVETTAPAETEAVQTEAAVTEVAEAGRTVAPLPDSTMENLTDAILSVSLQEGDAYVDDSGIMQMELKIYTYDRYDMVDMAALEPGDILVTHSGEVKVVSKEQDETGTIHINGGLENDGFDLVTDDSGIYYQRGFNDVKNWYEAGEATIRVSVDFEFVDRADLEQGEVIFYPGSFLIGEVTNYDFTPYNTTIRVAEGQIMEMTRVYTP